MLDRHELVVELPHLVEGGIEDSAQTCRRLRLRATRYGWQLADPSLGLCTERRRAIAGAIDERPWELLIEQCDRQMVGRELGVARTPGELLGRSHRFLALERQLLKVHVISS